MERFNTLERGEMKFTICKMFPPDTESDVVELNVLHDGVVDIPAEISRKDGQLYITLFGREGGAAWVYQLDEWVQAINEAVKALEDTRGA